MGIDESLMNRRAANYAMWQYLDEDVASYNEVGEGLYQGSFTALDDPYWMNPQLPRAFCDLSGLAVWDASDLDGVLRIQFAIDDARLEHPEEIRRIAHVLAEMSTSHEVLVTCAAGLNRSGVTVARTLMELGHDADEAIRLVRQARGPYALSNDYFVTWLLAE